ncbi:MAG: LysR family transcriptional regulator [Bermanella sp.]
MDIQLAKTFLEIMSAGSLLEAAKRLHVTQTTVTARVQNLEKELGCQLFVRNRAGASLTPDGERFAVHAKSLVLTWQRAKLDAAKPKELSSSLLIGAENSLWNPLMVETIGCIHKQHSISINAQADSEAVLLNQLEKGELDAVLVHTPNYHSRFVVELLMEEKLIHVQSAAEPQPDLFIDWGAQFKAQYDSALPQPRKQGFQTNLGPLALKVMLSQGGNGYFRTRVVQKYLESGELERVHSAPEFSYPVYLIYTEQSMSKSLLVFIQILKQQSKKLLHWPV